MKKILATLGLFLLGAAAHANDGGVYMVQPLGAKLEKSPRSFVFTGQYAQELKKLLPPSISVLTGMDPSLAKSYPKNFRALRMQDASGNALSLVCESGSVQWAEGKTRIQEKPETTCTIQLMDAANVESDSVKVPVKEALEKAQQANQL